MPHFVAKHVADTASVAEHGAENHSVARAGNASATGRPAHRANGKPPAFVITCEHGGNRIPPAYRHFFAGHEDLLRSHRGYDAGALQLARHMASALQAPLIAATVSRLLIDLNRSLHHRQLFSALLKTASKAERDAIVEHHYLPYRRQVEQTVAQAIAHGRQVIHVSCHSFTPTLDGAIRHADIGLLYDPQRQPEAALCRQWRQALMLQQQAQTVRLNYPYRGNADGLTTHLRRRHAAADYCGIELEINQAQIAAGPAYWRRLQEAVIAALTSVAGQLPAGATMHKV